MTPIPVLPKNFNFLGFESTTSINESAPGLKPILSLLATHYDEAAYLERAAKVFEGVNSLPITSPPVVSALPSVGGWYYCSPNGLVVSAPPKDGWWVTDTEASRSSPSDWSPLCAVATDGNEWRVWLPNSCGQAVEQLIPFEAKFIAHQSAYEESQFTTSQGSLCTMAIAAELFGASDAALAAVRKNSKVPWASKSLPAYVSLVSLAAFCGVPCHSKSTRDLCVSNSWGDNFRHHLLEILNYCIQDVWVTYQIAQRIVPVWMSSNPNPLDWLGWLEISKFRLPVDPNYNAWLTSARQKTIEDMQVWQSKIVSAVKVSKADDLAAVQKIESITPEFELDTPLFWRLCQTPSNAEKSSPSWGKKIVKDLKAAYSAFFRESLGPWVATRKIDEPSLTPTQSTSLDALTEPITTVELPVLLYKTHPLRRQLLNVEIAYGQAARAIATELELQPYPVMMAPKWVFDFKPSPSNTKLASLVGLTYRGASVEYEHPRYNVLGSAGEYVGEWWSKDVDYTELASPYLDAPALAEFFAASNSFLKFYDRLVGLRVINGEYVPQIHKSGTVTGRLTDNVVHVAPKHSETRHGSEIMGLFCCSEDEAFVYADYSGEETMIFQALADKGSLGSSGYGQIVLTGDMHATIRDILGFEGKKGRSRAKKYTFLLQFGGDVEGCTNYLMAEGYSKTEANAMATRLVRTYKGTRYGDYYRDGLASAGYNAITTLANAAHGLKSLILNRAAPYFLQPQVRGGQFKMTIGNWPVQATGTDILRMHFALTRLLAEDCKVWCRPAVSVHDLLALISKVADAGKVTRITQAAHLLCVARLYKNLGYKVCPEKFALFDEVSVDRRLRLTAHDPMITPTNPIGFSA